MTHPLPPLANPSLLCPDCRAHPPTPTDRQLAALATIADIRATMRSLELALRGLDAELRRATDSVRVVAPEHPRCAACGNVAGPGHAIETLRREPYGEALVGACCYRNLEASGETARAAIRREMVQDRAERGEGRDALSEI